MDKLSAIRTFVKVIETGKFSVAAEAMGIPPPRASQRVRDLENSLKIRLIDRTTKSLTLTREGQDYFETCRKLLHELDSAEDLLHGRTIGAIGGLRIEAVGSIGRTVIAPRLNEFKKDNPGIKIALSCSDRVSPLSGSGIDCFLRGGELDDSSYISRRLCNIHFGLYGSPVHAETIRHVDELRQCPKLGIFSIHPESAISWELRSGEHVEQIQPVWDGLFDDTESAINAAAGGAGVVAAPVFLAAEHVQAGRLLPILPDWSAGVKPLFALYPSARHIPYRLACFLEWAANVVQEHPFMLAKPIALTNGGN